MGKITVPKPPSATNYNVLKSMKGNRGKNTKPEMMLRSALHKEGLRIRIHYNLIGKPDIVFSSHKLTVFVDGCYWHGCPKCYKEPKTNTEYWKNKIARNKQRARTVNRQLNRDGWSVMRIWEHDVLKNIDSAITRIKRKISDEH